MLQEKSKKTYIFHVTYINFKELVQLLLVALDIGLHFSVEPVFLSNETEKPYLNTLFRIEGKAVDNSAKKMYLLGFCPLITTDFSFFTFYSVDNLNSQKQTILDYLDCFERDSIECWIDYPIQSDLGALSKFEYFLLDLLLQERLENDIYSKMLSKIFVYSSNDQYQLIPHTAFFDLKAYYERFYTPFLRFWRVYRPVNFTGDRLMHFFMNVIEVYLSYFSFYLGSDDGIYIYSNPGVNLRVIKLGMFRPYISARFELIFDFFLALAQSQNIYGVRDDFKLLVNYISLIDLNLLRAYLNSTVTIFDLPVIGVQDALLDLTSYTVLVEVDAGDIFKRMPRVGCLVYYDVNIGVYRAPVRGNCYNFDNVVCLSLSPKTEEVLCDFFNMSVEHVNRQIIDYFMGQSSVVICHNFIYYYDKSIPIISDSYIPLRAWRYTIRRGDLGILQPFNLYALVSILMYVTKSILSVESLCVYIIYTVYTNSMQCRHGRPVNTQLELFVWNRTFQGLSQQATFRIEKIRENLSHNDEEIFKNLYWVGMDPFDLIFQYSPDIGPDVLDHKERRVFFLRLGDLIRKLFKWIQKRF